MELVNTNDLIKTNIPFYHVCWRKSKLDNNRCKRRLKLWRANLVYFCKVCSIKVVYLFSKIVLTHEYEYH